MMIYLFCLVFRCKIITFTESMIICLAERKDLQRGRLVPIKHHSRQQAPSASSHRRRAAAHDHREPAQGRVPDAEGGRVGRLQPEHKWHQGAGGNAHQLWGHSSVLQPAELQGHASHQCEYFNTYSKNLC